MFAAYLAPSYQFLFQNTFSFKYPIILTGKHKDFYSDNYRATTAGKEKANCVLHHKTKSCV